MESNQQPKQEHAIVKITPGAVEPPISTIDREKIKAAVDALKGGNPSAILPAVNALSYLEISVVAIIIDMTGTPAKPKRGRPTGSKSRVAPIAEAKAS